MRGRREKARPLNRVPKSASTTLGVKILASPSKPCKCRENSEDLKGVDKGSRTGKVTLMLAYQLAIFTDTEAKDDSFYWRVKHIARETRKKPPHNTVDCHSKIKNSSGHATPPVAGAASVSN